jgi:protein SCO1/2
MHLGTLLLCVFALMSCSDKPLSFNSVDITGAEYARDLVWRDKAGLEHHLQDAKGQLVLVFFGYTQCPDVCPTSLSELKAIKASLGESGKKIKALFITVDPERDSQEVLDAYVANFGEDFSGVSLPAEQLKLAAKEFKVFYQKTPGPTPTSYGIEHTAGFYVYDTHGQLRLFVRYGTPQESLMKDLQMLLEHA